MSMRKEKGKLNEIVELYYKCTREKPYIFHDIDTINMACRKCPLSKDVIETAECSLNYCELLFIMNEKWKKQGDDS